MVDALICGEVGYGCGLEVAQLLASIFEAAGIKVVPVGWKPHEFNSEVWIARPCEEIL